MKSPTRDIHLLVLLIALGGTQAALAQNPYNWVGSTVTPGNWTDPANWDAGFPPDTTFDEVGIVSNGATALVNSAVSPTPGQITLGQLVGQSGGLTIANGGQMSAVFVPGNTSTGGVNVGLNGTGTLKVQPGGSLSTRSLTLAGETGSSLVIGGAAGGAATVDIEQNSSLGRATRIIGPNVTFLTLGVTFQSTSVYTPQITATTHSPIRSLNTAAVGGALRPEFTNGVVPAVGNKWNLIDAAAISGAFTVDASAAPVLPFGQSYRFKAVADPTSVNGVYGQLSVEQSLVLNVNRATGAVSINNGPSPISIDGYAIKSALGGLKPSGWSSLQDQAVSNWRESPPGGSVNLLAELKPTGATTVNSGAPLALGSAFQLPTPTQFGTELEDLAFEYYSAGGVVTQGIVNYIGNKQFNNLVLVVDPATGNARMENESALTVSIDGYRIESASASLRPGAGQWNSLDDQNAGGGDWRESNPSANLLAELKPTTSTAMTGGLNFGFNLGALFTTVASGGAQDLTFQYLSPGDTEFRNGVVAYRSLASFLAADFNHDTQVNGADLTIWKASFGVNAGGDANNDGVTNGSDFLVWQRQVGQSSTAAATAAVPEPASIALVIGAFGAMACVRTFRGETR